MNLDEYGLRQKNTAALFPNVSTKYSLISSKSQILSIIMFSKVPKITISIFNIHHHMNKTRHVFFLPFFRLELRFSEFPYYRQWIIVGTKRYFDRMSKKQPGKEWFHQKICSIGAISYFFGTKNDMEKDPARESEF